MNSFLILAEEKTWSDFENHIQENLGLYLIYTAGFIVFSVTVFLLVRHFRNRLVRREESIDHLTDFRKMNDEGLLLDKELSNIKKIVSDQQFGSPQLPKTAPRSDGEKESD